MSGLLKSDFYKLSKMKSFPICLLISIALAVGTICLIEFASVGEVEIVGSECLLSSFVGDARFFIPIVVSIFAASEFGFGTIKNIASRGFGRMNIYWSKLIVSCVIALVFQLVYSAAYTGTASILWGFGQVASDFWPHALAVIGLELLITLAFTALFVMVAMLIRQSGGAIAINMCIIMQFIQMIVSLISAGIDKLFNTELVLTDYLLSTNASSIAGPDVSGDMMIRELMFGIVYFVVFTAIGLWSFQKRDIK